MVHGLQPPEINERKGTKGTCDTKHEGGHEAHAPALGHSLRGLLLIPRLPQLAEDIGEPELAQMCVLLETLHEPVLELVRRALPECHPRLDLGRLLERRLAVRRGRVAYALVACGELGEGEVYRRDRRRLRRRVDEGHLPNEGVFRAAEQL